MLCFSFIALHLRQFSREKKEETSEAPEADMICGVDNRGRDGRDVVLLVTARETKLNWKEDEAAYPKPFDQLLFFCCPPLLKHTAFIFIV